MSATRVRQRSRSRRPGVLQKPVASFIQGFRKVGPEHFGVVSVDCAKARSNGCCATSLARLDFAHRRRT